MGVEQTELLAPMHRVESVVDIEHDPLRPLAEGGAIKSTIARAIISSERRSGRFSRWPIVDCEATANPGCDLTEGINHISAARKLFKQIKSLLMKLHSTQNTLTDLIVFSLTEDIVTNRLLPVIHPVDPGLDLLHQLRPEACRNCEGRPHTSARS
jgi:hypothetical protein